MRDEPHPPKGGLGDEWWDEKSGSSDPLLNQLCSCLLDYDISPQLLARAIAWVRLFAPNLP